MKLFYGHLIAFGMMTGFCFVALGALMLFFPLIGAFVAWELTPLSFGWSTAFLWMRIIFVFSALIGIAFTCSKEGQELAKEVANG